MQPPLLIIIMLLNFIYVLWLLRCILLHKALSAFTETLQPKVQTLVLLTGQSIDITSAWV